uniref:Uncharacterized protein n=1 Tax=Bactrocera latifrons TaxID=174628 RepID=A0A0K8VDP5_BACLA
MEEDIVATIINNLGDSNVQQLVNYIITDQDDIGQCFKLEGALKAEIDAEFNRMETEKLDYEYEGDDEDAMSTSSGYCSAAASSIDYYDSEERMSCSYATFYMDEKSQSSGISMYSSNASLVASELSLQKVNQSILDNAKFIQKQLQQLSIRCTKLKNIL